MYTYLYFNNNNDQWRLNASTKHNSTSNENETRTASACERSNARDKFVIYSPVFANATSRDGKNEELSIGRSLNVRMSIRGIRAAYCACGFSIEWSIDGGLVRAMQYAEKNLT